MAVNKKALSKLLSLSGAVTAENRRNVYDEVISTASPSLNFTFGGAHGLPSGYSLLLYGPPRGGKSVICNMMIGQLHRDDPDAIAIKFNTEFREGAQLSEAEYAKYGIDPERIVTYETNLPNEIYDRIEQDLAALIQDGLKVKLVIIDSLTGIKGRRALNSDTIMTQQIGDDAKTNQDGLKQILAVQRRCRFGLVLTSHIRAQIDPKAGVTGMVYKTQTSAVKPAVSYGTQHHCEYYMYVEPRGGKEGRTDESGAAFVDESVTDLRENGEQTAHRILCRMVDSSFGPKNRSGMFTFDYNKGIVNVHEEVFLLGTNRGIIERPTTVKYSFGGREWVGRGAMLEALKNDPQLQADVVKELKRRDLQGLLPQHDAVHPEEASQ